MLGIMGMGSAFINAAGRGGKKKPEQYIIRSKFVDFMLDDITCFGEISVISIKNGEKIIEKYNDLNNASLSVQNDANTDITIIGAVGCISSSTKSDSVGGFSAINASHLKKLWIETSSDNTLRSASISGAVLLGDLKIRQGVSNEIATVFANAISESTKTGDTNVFYGITDNAGNAIIKAASDAKGWTYVNDD